MKKLVIDIETVGIPWEEHDPYVREYLMKGLGEGDAEETRRAGGLSPFRGRIVTIGVINIEDGRSCALYEVPGQTDVRMDKVGPRTFISGTEKQILVKFWDFFDSDSRFISFNGRQFDGPFLMIRSAINGVIPKRDLVGYRYGFHPNCDIREALNFFGTTNSRQFKFNLDLACKAFGVETSKGEGLDGRSVETWYRAGKHREIAEYCLDDVRATAELYEKLAPTILIFNKEFREAEDRAARMAATKTLNVPSTEATFMEAVEQTSLALTASLEQDTRNVVERVERARHQAAVFEKLVAPELEEEEIPML
ncbi:MAG TPA: ribonuclease H-like domain-containing protein [Thermoanaerobaculia bacterium]|jgi:predicted PolB exonuclease-like 3'-5' exonuclease|nr:ribonuclease H-like domain-containing protein [Thermoanaerobaculia bacterium]